MKRSRIITVIGMALILFQAIVSAVALYRIKAFDALPDSKITLLIIFMMIALIVSIALQFFDKLNIVGCVFALAISIGMIWAASVVHKIETTIEQMGERRTVEVSMQLMIKSDSPFSSFREFEGKKIGICKEDEDFNITATKQLRKDVGADYIAAEYEDTYSLACALLNGNVDAIIMNSAKVDIVNDLFLALPEDDPQYLGTTSAGTVLGFIDVVKVIKNYTLTIETEPDTPDSSDPGEEKEKIDTAVTPFIVYVSGIDTAGDISSYGRSDVNIVLCINPVTKTVSMLSTPRDSYVPIPGLTDGEPYYDKLTHAGVYAEHAKFSIAAIEKLYGINIDYYIRVNFTSVENIVDALGGVNVYSKYEFDSKNILGEHFKEGYNQVNGKQALIFCRERFSFFDGDYQRGRNHIEMIKAILNKVMSPAILTKYDALLEQIASNVETNMTQSEITALVKMQLDDNATWNFVSMSASGINNGQQELRYTHSSKTAKSYVTLLDPESVNFVCDVMEKVLNGEKVTQDMIDNKKLD